MDISKCAKLFFNRYLVYLLASVELVIFALLGKEFVVIALLDDASVVHHTDDVGIADGGETMGNDKGGTPFHDVVHSLLH